MDMKLRTAKKWLKRSLRESGLEIVRTVKRLFIFKANHRVKCRRAWVFTACSDDHEFLPELLEEQETGKRWDGKTLAESRQGV
jgi:hypothetical protein